MDLKHKARQQILENIIVKLLGKLGATDDISLLAPLLPQKIVKTRLNSMLSNPLVL